MFALNVVSAKLTDTDRQRLRRSIEKKRLEGVKQIHEQLKSISKSEMDYVKNLRERFEPKITYPDVKEEEDD